ncbi:MAG: hypothetical protein U9O94_01755 [Nanoarchaeota archaeon]|nr:hypothetical protein [Nanoarchaeota archaeon]
MADLKILSEKAIDMNELRKELEKIKKRDKELNFRANKTEEYLQHFADLKNSEELFKKLDDLKIPRFREQHIAKIIDTLPKNAEDVKLILKAYPVTVSADSIKKIVDVVSKFLKK